MLMSSSSLEEPETTWHLPACATGPAGLHPRPTSVSQYFCVKWWCRVPPFRSLLCPWSLWNRNKTNLIFMIKRMRWVVLTHTLLRVCYRIMFYCLCFCAINFRDNNIILIIREEDHLLRSFCQSHLWTAMCFFPACGLFVMNGKMES